MHRYRTTILGLLALLVLLGLPPRAAWAQRPSLGQLLQQLQTFVERVEMLENANAALQTRVSTLETEHAAQQTTINDLQTQVTAWAGASSVPACLTAAANGDVVFEGCNVHIRSGAGATDDGGVLTGLGNLIIGYNEDTDPPNERTGSHNLIIGPQHTYSSYGGVVAGSRNTISGEHASVSGGSFNTASGERASVSGGQGNTASGTGASVSGGSFNTASGRLAGVSGGTENLASGATASVSGGSGRRAEVNNEWVAGGLSEPN
jgi:hypothetical protein